jgi:hypothetical protein
MQTDACRRPNEQLLLTAHAAVAAGSLRSPAAFFMIAPQQSCGRWPDEAAALSTQPFLVVYDYGQGGVWAWIRADSADAILERYPELKVIDTLPEWLTSAGSPTLPEHNLEDPPAGLLADLIAERRR